MFGSQGAEIRAIGITTSIEIFNDIVDRFCPLFENNKESLSDTARVQILRAIGVAIVKHGSMFPTLEILLRHAANYLDMKRHPALNSVGVIDDEVGLLADFDKISLPESRAVLCCHLLCYVLDGSVGFSELTLWSKMLARVEELYQVERAAFDTFGPEELRQFINQRAPNLARTLAHCPTNGGDDEVQELSEIVKSVPCPHFATTADEFFVTQQFLPRVLCQEFRCNVPLTTEMLMACFDPLSNMEYMKEVVSPPFIFGFVWNEFFNTFISLLTKQV